MNDEEIFAYVEPDNILRLIRERGRKGITLRMLVAHVVEELGVGRSEARQLLRESLRELQRDGRVVAGRGKRYLAAESSELIAGMVKRTASGAVVEETGSRQPPIRIDPRGLRGALDGDRVLVRLETPRRRARADGVREGVVAKVVERRLSTVVGRWVADRGRPHLRPVDRRLRFQLSATSTRLQREPRHGDFVVATVESVSARGDRARGVLLERLGRIGDAGIEETVALRVHGIPVEFPAEAIEEAEGIPGEITDSDLEGRWELRDRPAITIDPVDARDFDDAVSASRGNDREIEVEVHIADVSNYVRLGTALDAAARTRGTSVYLPGRCVSMLPERISNQLCTLREGVDRLSFTVRFAVDPEGEIVRFEAHDSVIRSRRRCTYEEVFGWLESPRDSWPDETSGFADSLELLAEAAERLGRARSRRGSLDFELAEPEILLDPAGRVTAIEARKRNRAHRLIEELMVAANHCVASILLDREQPTLHRVHDPPDPKKLMELQMVLAELGLTLPDDEGFPPSALQRVLANVAGRPEERLVSMLVLRSMMRALYSPEARGHYALATGAYLHFTSPIRRYPDLVAHRMLRRLQREGGAVGLRERDRIESDLVVLGESCSAAEQRAEAAERMAIEWKTILYLRDRVGEGFDGTVTGVTDFGLFVQLDGLFVDGLVHVSELMDDFYHLDDAGHRLRGERSGRTWSLGDRLRVQLVRVDTDEMRIELVPVEEVRRKK